MALMAAMGTRKKAEKPLRAHDVDLHTRGGRSMLRLSSWFRASGVRDFGFMFSRFVGSVWEEYQL